MPYLFTIDLHIIQKIQLGRILLTNTDRLIFSWIYFISQKNPSIFCQIFPWYSWEICSSIKRKNNLGCLYWKEQKLLYPSSFWGLGSYFSLRRHNNLYDFVFCQTISYSVIIWIGPRRQLPLKENIMARGFVFPLDYILAQMKMIWTYLWSEKIYGSA